MSDEARFPGEDAFLSRLTETGATESSCSDNWPSQMEEDRETASEKTSNILCNILVAINSLCHLKDGLYAAVLNEATGDGMYYGKIHIV